MEETKKKPEKKVSVKKLIAKKDWVISQNDVHIVIKKGDEVKAPKEFLEVLKTEKVI